MAEFDLDEFLNETSGVTVEKSKGFDLDSFLDETKISEEEIPAEEPTWWEGAWGTVAGIPSDVVENLRKFNELAADVLPPTPQPEDMAVSFARLLLGQENLPDWDELAAGQKTLVLGQVASVIPFAIAGIHAGMGGVEAAKSAWRTHRIKAGKFYVPPTRAEALKAAGKKVQITKTWGGKVEKIELKPIKPTAGTPTVAREVAMELRAIKSTITKPVELLKFKDTVNKQLYDLVGKVITEYKLSVSADKAVKPFIQTANAVVGSPIKGMVEIGFGQAAYSRINEVLPFMVNQLITSGEALPQIRKELKVEEEVVEGVAPTPEEYAAPEVAPKVKLESSLSIGRKLEAHPDDPVLLSQQAEAIYNERAEGVSEALTYPQHIADDNLEAAERFWKEKYDSYPEGKVAIDKAKEAKTRLATIEVAPKAEIAPREGVRAEIPEEKIPFEETILSPELEESLAGGPVLGKGFDIRKGWPIMPEPERGTLGEAVDKTIKAFSVYTRIKKEDPEAYFKLREFKGGEDVAFTKAKQMNERMWGKIDLNQALAIQRHRQNPEKYPLEKLAHRLRPVAGRIDALLEGELEDFISMGKMKVGWPSSQINQLNEEKEKLLAEISLLTQKEAIQKRQDRIAEIDELTDLLPSRRFFPGRYMTTPETQSSMLKFLPEGVFRGSRLREKWISGKTIPDIDAAIEAGLEPRDPRATMLDHLFWAELEKNKWILHEGIKSNPNLALPEEYAPEWWDDYPGFKEYKLNPMITDVLKEFDLSVKRGTIEEAYRKFAALGKRAVFWNFIIMGGVYDPQQGLRAAGLGAVNPITYSRNIKSVITKDEGYKFWAGLDLFSKPVDIQPQRDVQQLIESAVRQMNEATPGYARLIERLTDGEWNFKDTTKIQKITKSIKGLSSLEWNLAWGLDAASRKTTAERLVAMGLSPREAAEKARFHHADYGDVPGQTRRFLNLGMLTPTYQIASGKVYLKMMRHPIKEKGPIARTIGFQILVAIGMGILGYRWTRGNTFVKKISKNVEDVISNPGPLYWLNKQIRDPRVSVFWQSSVPLNILLSITTNNDGLGGKVYDRKASKEAQYAQTAEFAIKRWLRPLESAGRLTDEGRLLLDRLLSLVAITKYQRKPWKEKKKTSKQWWRGQKK